MSAVSPTMMAHEPHEPLSKVDSLIDAPKSPKHRRRSSTAADVYSIIDLEQEHTPIEIAIETQKLGWKVNTPSTTIEEKEWLALPLCTPKLKKIDLIFQAGLHVVARNPKGVTIKDAVDAIYKANKKKDSEELAGLEYLRGFEWDPKECYTRFVVHLQSEAAVRKPSEKGGKKKNKRDSTSAWSEL